MCIKTISLIWSMTWQTNVDRYNTPATIQMFIFFALKITLENSISFTLLYIQCGKKDFVLREDGS